MKSYLSASNRIIMKKIKSFKIKDCEDCFYWQSEERINQKEFCASHQDKDDQPLGILKAIQWKKKEWREQKSLYLLLIIAMSISFGVSLMAFCYFAELNNLVRVCVGFTFGYSTLNILSKLSSFIETKKLFKEELKELNQKKTEWIIEYE